MSTEIKLNELINQCELDLRAGNVQKAAQCLLTLNTAKIPRTLRIKIANLGRRAGIWNFGLRILAPVVRPVNASFERATPEEVAEYGVLLLKNGSLREASELLHTVDAKIVPEVTMFRAFCHMARWEYSLAIPLIEEYLRKSEDTYSAFVARVNLASSLVSARHFASALELLNGNITQAQDKGYHRLLGNCLEMRSQIFLYEKRYAECRRDLESARQIFGEQVSLDSLFVQKWQAILAGHENQSPDLLRLFKQSAIQNRHWESVRDADFHILQSAFERHGFDHLTFGTPYSEYRARVQETLGCVQDRELFEFGVVGAEKSFDVSSGELLGNGKGNRPSQAIHRLLGTLLEDFYRPPRMAALFAALAPDEHFDPFTSANRVHQVVFRARQWLKKCTIPMAIDDNDGQFQLRVTGRFAFLVEFQRDAAQSKDPFEREWRRLRNAFPSSELFTCNEACEQLQVSPSSFQRLATWAADKGRLTKVGKSRGTRYKIAG